MKLADLLADEHNDAWIAESRSGLALTTELVEYEKHPGDLYRDPKARRFKLATPRFPEEVHDGDPA